MAPLIGLQALAKLLTYPQGDLPQITEELMAHMAQSQCPAQELVGPFVHWVSQTPLAQQEEEYIRVFDFDPATSLELGWHLYGENYERGAFLVKMREALAGAGIAETAELPDHLAHVLQLLAVLPQEEAAAMAREIVRPALNKLMPGVEKKETPYLAVLKTLQGIMAHKWGVVSEGVAC